MDREETAWWVLLIAVQAADVITTRLNLNRGGYEQNPIARWLHGRFGFRGFVVAKIALLVPIAYYFVRGGRDRWTAPASAFFSSIVAPLYNIREYRRDRMR